MDPQTESQRKPLERFAARFESIGQELKARARLATAEARQAWDRAHLERIGAELTKVRDEAKVQLHLASLDARDALREVEKKISELRDQAGLGVDHVVKDLNDRIQKLTRALRRDSGEPRAAR